MNFNGRKIDDASVSCVRAKHERIFSSIKLKPCAFIPWWQTMCHGLGRLTCYQALNDATIFYVCWIQWGRIHYSKTLLARGFDKGTLPNLSSAIVAGSKISKRLARGCQNYQVSEGKRISSLDPAQQLGKRKKKIEEEKDSPLYIFLLSLSPFCLAYFFLPLISFRKAFPRLNPDIDEMLLLSLAQSVLFPTAAGVRKRKDAANGWDKSRRSLGSFLLRPRRLKVLEQKISIGGRRNERKWLCQK